MRKLVAPFAIVGLLVFTAAGSAINDLVTSHKTESPSFKAGARFQETPTPTPRPGTRCLPARLERCARAGERNTPPEVELKASEQKVILACRGGAAPQSCTPSASQQVRLQANAADADGDYLRYSYSATGGRLSGEGTEVTWDLAGVRPGTYTASVEADDACGCVAFSSVRVKVEACPDCGDSPR